MQPIVQVILLGRFGNQLFQLAAADAYARAHGARLEVGGRDAWLALSLFDLTPWSCTLPETPDHRLRDPRGGPGAEWGRTNVRIGGYFQYQAWADILDHERLRQFFELPRYLVSVCRDARPRPCICAHLRRGDYVGHPLYCTVSEKSYHDACIEYGLEGAFEWIREDRPRCAAVPQELAFLPDFVTMMNAEVLLRANSSFSLWAGILGHAEVYAPVVENKIGEHDVHFVKGNWPRCADSSCVGVPVTDFHVPGT